MRPVVNRKWRKRSPAYHKSKGEKRIEDKDRKALDKEVNEYKQGGNKNNES